MRLIARWGPVVVWMAIIFALSAQSSLPHATDPIRDVVMRKVAHFTEYAILGILVLRAFGGPTSRRNGALALAIAVLYAISDELHQSLVPLRMPSPVDVLIDSCGALAGIAASFAWEAYGSLPKTSPNSH